MRSAFMQARLRHAPRLTRGLPRAPWTLPWHTPCARS
jgi:hypothetical protein